MEDPSNRRQFLRDLAKFPCSAVLLGAIGPVSLAEANSEQPYDAADHYYGMGIQVDRCIGCGRCVEACKSENHVIRQPFYFRTWVERYVVHSDGEVTVDSPGG